MISNKSLAVMLVLILVLSISITFYVFTKYQTAYGSSYTSLDLKISPSGNSFKLGVNQTQIFTAKALNGTAPFSYSWSVSASGNFSLLIDGNLTQVYSTSSLSFEGSNLTVCYPQATSEFVSLTVSVHDGNGWSGSTWKPIVVADPYLSPGYKFDGSTATASMIVQTDELGWYRAINGSDGSVAFSSTNAATVFQNSINAASSISGEVYVKNGFYSVSGRTLLTGAIYATIIMQQNVRLIGESENGVIIQQAGSTSASIIGNYHQSNTEISYLTLDGNRANQVDGGVDGNQAGIYDASDYTVINYVNSTNCVRDGIYESGGQFCHIEHDYAYNTLGTGIMFSSPEYSYISDVYGVNSGIGVELDNLKGTTVGTVSAINNTGPNIWVRGQDYSGAWAGNYANNVGLLYSKNSGSTGILIGEEPYVMKAWHFGEIFSDNDGTFGVYANNVSNCVFDSIYILNPSVASSHDAVEMVYGSNNKISYLYAEDNRNPAKTVYAYAESGSSSQNIISSGDLEGAIWLSGQKPIMSLLISGGTKVYNVNNFAVTSPIKVYLGNSQTIGANSLTKVQFNNTIFDPLGQFDNITNYRFNVVYSGYYRVSGSVVLATGNSYLSYVSIKVNAVVQDYFDSETNSTASIMFDDTFFLSAGQYVEVFFQTSNPSGVTLGGNNGETGHTYSFLNIQNIS